MQHSLRCQTGRATRRRFLAGTAAALAAPWIVPASALGRNGALPPSERITIGMLGVGNRGSGSCARCSRCPIIRCWPSPIVAAIVRSWASSSCRVFMRTAPVLRRIRAARSTMIFGICSRTMTSMSCGDASPIIGMESCTARRFRPARTSTAKSRSRGGSRRGFGFATRRGDIAACSRPVRSNAARPIFATPANWRSTVTWERCIRFVSAHRGEILPGRTARGAPCRFRLRHVDRTGTLLPVR